MIGQTVSHYKILEELGGGGMGVVYKAEDTKLKRTVALKFLPAELTRNKDAKTRFIHEAQAASALQHHNICTIHEIDESPDGNLFICMDCYEGETLKEKITEGPMSVGAVLDIVIQAADGLSKAHAAGMVHRDVKPANIMVTRDNVVKILDFGLAKLTGQTKVTRTGTTVGTVAYMSPEQASGQEMDARSDIFSLGVVLYELLTGYLPFPGDHEAAVMYGIMHNEPNPLSTYRNDIPDKLQSIITGMLRKEPAERYESVSDLKNDLEILENAVVESGKRRRRASASAGLTQRTSKRRWLFALGIGIVVIAAALAGMLLSRSERTITDHYISIAIADFTNETQDDALSSLSGMLITSLQQSPNLSILTRSNMFDILKRLGKEDVDRIDEANGRDICVEAKVSALGVPTIRKFGGRYVIDLNVIDPRANKFLFSTQMEGEGKENIPSMIDEVSKKVRSEFREKADVIQSMSPEVATITTSNLEAYKEYFLGEQLINELKFDEASLALGKAVELDSTFALAQYRLAYALAWSFSPGAEIHIKAAMRHIEKIPERERYLARAISWRLKGNTDQAIAMCREMLDLYPNEKEALWLIGDWSWHDVQYTEAIDYFQKVLSLDPKFERALHHIVGAYEVNEDFGNMQHYADMWVRSSPNDQTYSMLGDAIKEGGDVGKASSVFTQALSIFPDRPLLIVGRGGCYFCEGEYRKAEEEFAQLTESGRPLTDQRQGYWALCRLNLFVGKYREALRMIDKMIAIDLKRQDQGHVALDHALKAVVQVSGWNDVGEANAEIEEALGLRHAADVFLYETLFPTCLMIGEYEKLASADWAELVRSLSPLFDALEKAFVFRSGSEYREAIREFQWVCERSYPGIKAFAQYYLTLTCIESGLTEQALGAARKLSEVCYFKSGDYPSLIWYVLLLPKAYCQVAQAHEEAGDIKSAHQAYEEFLELWRNADSDLPDLVYAKTRIAELGKGNAH